MTGYPPVRAADIRSHPLTTSKIIALVAEHFKLDPKELRKRTDRAIPRHARQVAMYLTKEQTDRSVRDINESFNTRKDSIVLDAITQIAAQRKHDAELDALLNTITDKLLAP